ncbi:MAG: VanW family protein [Sandaracinaceae bacterium]
MQTHASRLGFSLRVAAHQAARALRERDLVLPAGETRERPASGWRVVGRSATPLWPETVGAEARLIAGKVQNLRVAVRRIGWRRFEAGELFSFWRHVGRPTRRAGFVEGREIREGCLVASVGGGLCQLSNGLYDAALDAGLEVVERHGHTVVVPGSLAERGRDATVFWRYVDLRLRAPHPFELDVRLTSDALVVRVWAPPRRRALPIAPASDGPTRPGPTGQCVDCGRAACPSHAPRPAAGPRAPRSSSTASTPSSTRSSEAPRGRGRAARAAPPSRPLRLADRRLHARARRARGRPRPRPRLEAPRRPGRRASSARCSRWTSCSLERWPPGSRRACATSWSRSRSSPTSRARACSVAGPTTSSPPACRCTP